MPHLTLRRDLLGTSLYDIAKSRRLRVMALRRGIKVLADKLSLTGINAQKKHYRIISVIISASIVTGLSRSDRVMDVACQRSGSLGGYFEK